MAYIDAARYREHLASSAWKWRRERALTKADRRCQVCNGTTGLEVHHRSYATFGAEAETDLVVLCEACHDLFHTSGRLVPTPDAPAPSLARRIHRAAHRLIEGVLMIRRLSVFLVSLVALAVLLTACGGTYVSYTPPAYGANNSCYFVYDPQEVTGPGGLWDAGLCPRSWVPLVMPLSYHYAYASFYDSPAYYSVYAPPAIRTTYVTNVQTFEKSPDYAANQKTAAATAQWKGTDGKSYNGSTVQTQQASGKASFGGGAVRSSGFSSGDVRNSQGKPAANQATTVSKPATAAPAISAPATRPASGGSATTAPIVRNSAPTAAPNPAPAIKQPSPASSGGFGSGARSQPVTPPKK